MVAQARTAYVWSGPLSATTAAEFEAPSAYSYNSTGSSNRIRRHGVGNYTVLFGGPAGAGDTSHAQVQAYGAEPGQCRTNSWSSGGNPATVSVRCFNGSGAAADRPFVAFFASATSASCGYAVSPATLSAPAAGGTVSLSVTAAGTCGYRVSPAANWASVSGTGTLVRYGSSTVDVAVQPNPGPEDRQTEIQLGGRSVTLRQAGSVSCSYAVSVAPSRFPAAGSTEGRLDIVTSPPCGWTATGPAWVSFPEGASRIGVGSVRFVVGPNSASALRSGVLAVGGQGVAIEQDAAGTAACSYSLAPSAANFPVSGGLGSVELAAAASCGWTAASLDPWITVQPPTTGAGPARLSYRVEPNPGTAARSGRLQVQGGTVTVSQSGTNGTATACSYSMAPFTLRADTTTRTYRVQVRTQPGCAWTATPEVAWLRINSGATGSGSGSFELQAANYSGNGRRGTVAVAGERLTVSQGEQACAWLIDVPLTDFPQAGGTVTVTAGATYLLGCYALFPEDWSRPSWVRFPREIPYVDESGPNRGRVQFPVTFLPNPDSSPRSGVLAIEGVSYLVTQAGGSTGIAPCTVAVPAAPMAIGSAGGMLTVNVGTSGGGVCSWTAQSEAGSWISLPDGGSGTGPLSLRIAVSANGTALPRGGAVVVNGQRIEVEQQGGGGSGTMVISNIVNSGSFTTGVSSGSWATIFGTGLSTFARSWEGRDFGGGVLPKVLDGVRVLVNGREAAIAYISPGQINFQLPDVALGRATVEVSNGASGGRANFNIQNLEAAPALFGYAVAGRIHAAAVHADGALVGPSGVGRPARPGQMISLFGTGFGPTNPLVPAGTLFAGAAPLRIPALVRLTAPDGNSLIARLAFAGLSAPGLYQFNITIPDTALSGDLAVSVEQLGLSTQQGLFVAVQR